MPSTDKTYYKYAILYGYSTNQSFCNRCNQDIVVKYMVYYCSDCARELELEW